MGAILFAISMQCGKNHILFKLLKFRMSQFVFQPQRKLYSLCPFHYFVEKLYSNCHVCNKLHNASKASVRNATLLKKFL